MFANGVLVPGDISAKYLFHLDRSYEQERQTMLPKKECVKLLYSLSLLICEKLYEIYSIKFMVEFF